MDAVLHHFTQRMAILLFSVLVTLSIQFSHFCGQTSGCGEQEVTTTTRRVTHLDRQQCGTRLLRIGLKALLNHRQQCGLNQL